MNSRSLEFFERLGWIGQRFDLLVGQHQNVLNDISSSKTASSSRQSSRRGNAYAVELGVVERLAVRFERHQLEHDADVVQIFGLVLGQLLPKTLSLAAGSRRLSARLRRRNIPPASCCPDEDSRCW